ncbi:DMT family transporter [Sphingomonas sp.]|uniref:DMT family transporter n=1 Tax=Sphingomonas sp. TaxID=28214 RepID=UPI002FC9C22D
MRQNGSRLGAVWNSAYLLLTITALSWAGNIIVGRAAREFVPPMALSFWRWLVALLLLLPFAWPYIKKDWPVLRRRWPILLMFGSLGAGTFSALLYYGLQYTTALNVSVLNAAQAAMMLVMGMLIFRDSASRSQIVGVVLSLVGVLAIVSKGDPAVLLALRLNIGDALILLAGLLWAVYAVFLRKRPDVHPLSFFAAILVVGLMVVAPLYLHELSRGRRIVQAPESWLFLAFVAVFPSLIAQMFFNRGVELIGAARAGQFLNISPALGALFAILLLGERFGLYHVIGMTLIGAGILLGERRPPLQRAHQRHLRQDDV